MLEYYYAEAKLRDSRTAARQREASQRREAELFVEKVRRTRLASIFRPVTERSVKPPARLMWT